MLKISTLSRFVSPPALQSAAAERGPPGRLSNHRIILIASLYLLSKVGVMDAGTDPFWESAADPVFRILCVFISSAFHRRLSGSNKFTQSLGSEAKIRRSYHPKRALFPNFVHGFWWQICPRFKKKMVVLIGISKSMRCIQTRYTCLTCF